MLLIGQHSGPPQDLLSGGLGFAAILLVAGWIFTRWQRDRQRFALMQTALEKGVTRFPGTPAYWLVSLRQGVTLTAVGVGLMVVGGGAWGLTAHVEMPVETPITANASPNTSPTSGAASSPKADSPQVNGPQDGPPETHDGWNRGPRARGGPPMDGPEEHEGPGEEPHGRRGEFGPERSPDHQPAFERGHPPQAMGGPGREQHETPDRERWHRAEAQRTIGLTSVGVGFILTLLGLVRIGFAKIEQNHTKDSDDLGIS